MPSIPRSPIHRRRRRVLAGCLVWPLLLWAGPPSVAAAADVAGLPESELRIVTEGGDRHRFQVEVARTPAEQSLGLMYRQSLAADRGMLFAYRVPRVISMWMKNTFIPLDMLFIGEDGRIGHIAADTTPLSEASISSEGPAIAVLEVPGGTAERLGIRVGDRVEHAIFDD
ncbi:MAG TPA: DUF192 domain-containing protein [Geminicoccaceae bacterium]|nr:DUF192 domain-containing protein [Geminicoccaceae bacterium]